MHSNIASHYVSIIFRFFTYFLYVFSIRKRSPRGEAVERPAEVNGGFQQIEEDEWSAQITSRYGELILGTTQARKRKDHGREQPAASAGHQMQGGLPGWEFQYEEWNQIAAKRESGHLVPMLAEGQ